MTRAFQAAMIQGVKAFATKLLKKENIEALESGEKKLEDFAVNVRKTRITQKNFSIR